MLRETHAKSLHPDRSHNRVRCTQYHADIGVHEGKPAIDPFINQASTHTLVLHRPYHLLDASTVDSGPYTKFRATQCAGQRGDHNDMFGGIRTWLHEVNTVSPDIAVQPAVYQKNQRGPMTRTAPYHTLPT